MIPSSEFAALFEIYYPKLYGYIRSQMADQATAEDITATAFERAYLHRHTYDAAKGSFATWLFRIARNLVINHHTAAGRQPVQQELDEALPVSSSTPSPEQHLLQQEQQLHLQAGLNRLSNRDQEIIHLRFFGQLQNREIARLLDLNEKTVSVIILRALQKLKTRLEAENRP
jgi:RNA polymerase sigma-70 factor (ECF subfamily)